MRITKTIVLALTVFVSMVLPAQCLLNERTLKLGSNAGGPTAPYSLTPGAVMTITVKPTVRYATDYLFTDAGANTSSTFVYSTQWRIPNAADLPHIQAIESDLNQVKTQNGTRYTGGIQFLFTRGGGPSVRYFNIALQKWIAISGLIMPLKDTNWHSMSFTYTINYSANTETYQKVTVDGVTKNLGITIKGVPSNWSPTLHAAVQLDVDSQAHPYTLQVRNWTTSPCR